MSSQLAQPCTCCLCEAQHNERPWETWFSLVSLLWKNERRQDLLRARSPLRHKQPVCVAYEALEEPCELSRWNRQGRRQVSQNVGSQHLHHLCTYENQRDPEKRLSFLDKVDLTGGTWSLMPPRLPLHVGGWEGSWAAPSSGPRQSSGAMADGRASWASQGNWTSWHFHFLILLMGVSICEKFLECMFSMCLKCFAKLYLLLN